MAPVENRDLPLSRNLFVFAPQESMVQFFGSGFSEMSDAYALGVHSLKNPVDDPIFAACIHCLQDNENFLYVLSIQHLLEFSKFLVELLRLLLLILVLALETRS